MSVRSLLVKLIPTIMIAWSGLALSHTIDWTCPTAWTDARSLDQATIIRFESQITQNGGAPFRGADIDNPDPANCVTQTVTTFPDGMWTVQLRTVLDPASVTNPNDTNVSAWSAPFAFEVINGAIITSEPAPPGSVTVTN